MNISSKFNILTSIGNLIGYLSNRLSKQIEDENDAIIGFLYTMLGGISVTFLLNLAISAMTALLCGGVSTFCVFLLIIYYVGDCLVTYKRSRKSTPSEDTPEPADNP